MEPTVNQVEVLNDEDMYHAMEHGEFPLSLRTKSRRVVVVMTQDWCPQWLDMASWLGQFTDQATIVTLEYNKHPRFEDIMTFKEDHWNNRSVPYVRAYLDGELLTTSNWLPKNTFAALLKRENKAT